MLIWELENEKTYVNNKTSGFCKRSNNKFYSKNNKGDWELCTYSINDLIEYDFEEIGTIYAIGTRLKIVDKTKTTVGKISYISKSEPYFIYIECGQDNKEEKYPANKFLEELNNGKIILTS